jgi:hypothetical protein
MKNALLALPSLGGRTSKRFSSPCYSLPSMKRSIAAAVSWNCWSRAKR